MGESKSVVVETPDDDPRETEVTMRVLVRWLNRRGQAIGSEQALSLPAGNHGRGDVVDIA